MLAPGGRRVNQKEERTTMLMILLELKINRRMGGPRC